VTVFYLFACTVNCLLPYPELAQPRNDYYKLQHFVREQGSSRTTPTGCKCTVLIIILVLDSVRDGKTGAQRSSLLILRLINTIFSLIPVNYHYP